MASPFRQATDTIQGAFASYQPQCPEDFIDFFKGLPEFVGEIVTAASNLRGRMESEHPIHPTVIEEYGELVAVLAGVRDKADELNGLFRRLHAPDIARAETPRTGESSWNVVTS